jgi:hypothetical protein
VSILDTGVKWEELGRVQHERCVFLFPADPANIMQVLHLCIASLADHMPIACPGRNQTSFEVVVECRQGRLYILDGPGPKSLLGPLKDM